MDLRRIVCASALAASISAAGLFGVGLGTAAAAPGGGCGVPNTPACGPGQPGPGPSNGPDRGRDDGPGRGPNSEPGQPGPGPNDEPGQGRPDWQGRGVDQGRNDHQPFNWNGQQVTPVPAGNGAGWGFWFLGTWIPL